MGPEVVSVNVGAVRELHVGDRVITTAIWKFPVQGRVAISGVNAAGDDQADRTVHGGPDKAIYAYAVQDAEHFARQTGRDAGPAPFGENLTVTGIDLSAAVIGELWDVGTARLQVCQPRVPCFKLGLRHEDPQMVKRFAQERRPGAYLRIVREGDVGAGDAITVSERPAHGVTIADVNEVMLFDRSGAGELLAAPELPRPLLEWFASLAAR